MHRALLLTVIIGIKKSHAAANCLQDKVLLVNATVI